MKGSLRFVYGSVLVLSLKWIYMPSLAVSIPLTPVTSAKCVNMPASNSLASSLPSIESTLIQFGDTSSSSSSDSYTELKVKEGSIRRPSTRDVWANSNSDSTGSIGTSSASNRPNPRISLGLLVPHTTFRVREYNKAVTAALTSLRRQEPEFFHVYRFSTSDIHMYMLKVDPSPTAILTSLCETFLLKNVSSVLFLSNTEKYGRNTASAQYFLQLADYLGVPVVAWNADNSGLEKRRSASSGLMLQMAPSIAHQAAAMLSLLQRYSWHQFSIVTSHVAGYNDFVQAVRDAASESDFKFTIIDTIIVSSPDQEPLSSLVNSEARILLLYSTREEARGIFSAATALGLTGEKYVWIVTQSVLGSNTHEAPEEFPVGMLGVHFDTSDDSLMKAISTALKVFVYGVKQFDEDTTNTNTTLQPQLSCDGHGDSRWAVGERFFKYLQNVTIEGDSGKPRLEFNSDGTLKAVELIIMNLRPGIGSSGGLTWTEIGRWQSWKKQGLDIKDIVWPGYSHVPPQGVPEKFHLKIVFLDESPFINLAPADPVTGRCHVSQGVLCRVSSTDSIPNGTMATSRNHSASAFQCCSGFCIDLLQKLAEDLGFTYDLSRVEDPKWGVLVNGKWNGLMGVLAHRKADMVMSSLIINSERESVADFSLPFMETGIAILVAKRTGIISATAFLEPFDTASWLLVGVVAIQAAAFAIFMFEWLSPSGYNMQLSPPSNQRFSLFRTYWLVWAILFQAAVNVDCPRGFTSRFVSNVWASFAVVFLAIYTANLAAFMITREEFFDFSGVEDPKLTNPMSHEPPLKFGTVFSSHTEATIKRYYPTMYQHMKNYSKNRIREGIQSVKTGELDAFLYDGAVLDYLVAQDEECTLLTVGNWYAMTGYGLAFPRGSKHLQSFNERLLEYTENGDLERLRRFWLTGICKPHKQDRQFSEPLATEQFLSAFLLLISGIGLAICLLALEHLYFTYIRAHLAKTGKGACCSLISINMGRSLTFSDAVFETQDRLRQHRCRDTICNLHLRRMRLQLQRMQARLKNLEELLHVGTNIGSPSGLDPYRWDVELSREDYTKELTTNSSRTNVPMHLELYRSLHEVSEMETVL